MKRALLGALLVASLAGCGGGDDETGTFAGEEVPKCSAILSDGATVPDDYEGCLSEDGSLSAVFLYDCEDGSEMYVQDADGVNWWSVGGKFVDGGTDGTDTNPDYAAAFDACNPS